MKSIKIGVFIIISSMFSICCTLEQNARIEIKNNSGSVVNNITFGYSASSGERKLNIRELANNCIYTNEVQIAPLNWGLGAGCYVADCWIEYYIGSQRFDIQNDVDVIHDVNEFSYSNTAILCDGRTTIIHISANGYKITSK